MKNIKEVKENDLAEILDLQKTAFKGAQKNAVLANSAFAIQTINPSLSIEECEHQAREAVDSGKIKETFQKFLELNN